MMRAPSSNIVVHPRAAQAALKGVRFLHPLEISEELAGRLANKMEALAHDAYLDGHNKGFTAGWINGATMGLAFSLVAAALAAYSAFG